MCVLNSKSVMCVLNSKSDINLWFDEFNSLWFDLVGWLGIKYRETYCFCRMGMFFGHLVARCSWNRKYLSCMEICSVVSGLGNPTGSVVNILSLPHGCWFSCRPTEHDAYCWTIKTWYSLDSWWQLGVFLFATWKPGVMVGGGGGGWGWRGALPVTSVSCTMPDDCFFLTLGASWKNNLLVFKVRESSWPVTTCVPSTSSANPSTAVAPLKVTAVTLRMTSMWGALYVFVV